MVWRIVRANPRFPMPRIHVLIHGRVQGVFFRASVVERALALGLTGWVRNRRDDSVECVAEGERPALDALLAYCRTGPPGAVVDEVSVRDERETGEFDSFGYRSDR